MEGRRHRRLNSDPPSPRPPPKSQSVQRNLLCWFYSCFWFLAILFFGLLCCVLIILLMSSNTSHLNYIEFASKKRFLNPLINGTCTLTRIPIQHSAFPYQVAPFGISVDQCFLTRNETTGRMDVLVCQKGLAGLAVSNPGIGLPVWSVGDRVKCRISDGDTIFVTGGGDRLMIDVGNSNSMWSGFALQITMVVAGTWCLLVMVVATIACPIASCAFVRGSGSSDIKSRAYCACGWGLPILILFLPLAIIFAVIGVVYTDIFFRTFPRPLDSFACEIGHQSIINQATPTYELIPINPKTNYTRRMWHAHLLDGTPFLNAGDQVRCCVGDSDGIVELSFMCSSSYRRILTLQLLLCVAAAVIAVVFVAAACVTHLSCVCGRCVDRTSGIGEKAPLLRINSRAADRHEF